MIKTSNSHKLWVEKYRPITVQDLIMPREYLDKFQSFVNEGKVPNILLHSNSPGLGKSSLTTSIIKDLDADVLWINGSKDSGIDILRTKVVDFAVSESIDDSPKIIVVDECDYLSDKSQAALRGVLEEFANNVSFIFTCNYIDRLIPALVNRFQVFNFDDIFHKNKKELAGQAYKRLCWILENEEVQYSKDDIKNLVLNYYPEMRTMIMLLQKHTFEGKLDLSNAVVDISNQFKIILGYIKNKDFTNTRKEISNISDTSSIYSYIFKNLDDYFLPKSQPQVIMLCAKYQEMNSHARDKSITATAFCVELMGSQNIEMV